MKSDNWLKGLLTRRKAEPEGTPPSVGALRIGESPRQGNGDWGGLSASQFVSELSHELRSPLSAVQGLSELMIKRSDTGGHPSEQDFTHKINFASLLMTDTLNDAVAYVMLKEGRRLIVVPRETPMSLPDLRNMVLAAEAGAMVLPAMPAFYQKPQSLDDLGAFIAGKILGALGIAHDLFPAWGSS